VSDDATSTSPPTVKGLMLPRGRVSYREAGSGTPVMIVPGLGLTGRFYNQSFPVFAAAGLRLIVPDLPGTGETDGPATGIGAEEVAEFLIEFTEALKLRATYYIGHSLGTQAVLLLAMRAPALVAGIGLVGPTGSAEKWKLVHQVAGLSVEGLRVHPSVIGAVLRDYVRVSPARYLGSWIKHRAPVADGRLTHISCPCLLVLGERDAVIDADYIALLRRDIPHLEVVELRDGSHALPRSQHTEFERAVIEFVARARGFRAR
jgi:pimeloyl-ACP methyl ester carboxylesterase